MEPIFWTGYSNQQRHIALGTIQNVISKYGDVIDFKMFSDVSISLIIEVEESKTEILYQNLKDIIAIDGFKPINPVSQRERTIYLNVNFTLGTGDLKIDVPSVPG